MYLKGVDGATVRRNEIFAIRELERRDATRFELVREGIGRGSTGFSGLDGLPHSPSISTFYSILKFEALIMLHLDNPHFLIQVRIFD